MERIRFSCNQNIGEGTANFDDWKCPTQQSFIRKEVTSYKIVILGRVSLYYLENQPLVGVTLVNEACYIEVLLFRNFFRVVQTEDPRIFIIKTNKHVIQNLQVIYSTN